MKRLPVRLKGACLHTNQTYLQREKVLREVAEGRVSVLLLSPEALVGGTLWKRGGGAYSLHDSSLGGPLTGYFTGYRVQSSQLLYGGHKVGSDTSTWTLTSTNSAT